MASGLSLDEHRCDLSLSPQAKGKIERPYRWLQDRIVRTCALEHITTLTDARPILREEVHRYNYHQVHSTTHEIPAVRFEKAQKEHRSLFRPFVLPTPLLLRKMSFAYATAAPPMAIAVSRSLDIPSRSLALSREKMSIFTSSQMKPKT